MTTFGGRPAFCVLWGGVGPVGYYADHDDKLNMFELLLVSRGDQGAGDFDIVFNYERIEWETGDASGGAGGLGGLSARAGYSNGSGTVGTSLELAGSGVNGAFLEGGASSLSANSRGTLTPGRYIFEVRNGLAPSGGNLVGTVNNRIRRGSAGVTGPGLSRDGHRGMPRHAVELDRELHVLGAHRRQL